MIVRSPSCSIISSTTTHIHQGRCEYLSSLPPYQSVGAVSRRAPWSACRYIINHAPRDQQSNVRALLCRNSYFPGPLFELRPFLNSFQSGSPSKCAFTAGRCNLAMLLLSRHLSNSRVALIVIISGLLGYYGLLCTITTDSHPPAHRPGSLPQTFLLIPPEYGTLCGSADENRQSQACSDTVSARYLCDFRDHALEYQSSTSTDRVTCFHAAGQDRDLFCMARGVVLDKGTGRFAIDNCDITLPGQEESSEGAIYFDERQRQIGAAAVFDRYFHIDRRPRRIALESRPAPGKEVQLHDIDQA